MSINISQAIFYPNILTGKIVAVDLFAQKIELLSVNKSDNRLNVEMQGTYFSNYSLVNNYLSRIRTKSNHIGYILLSTLGCNLNCTYCYEKDLVDKKAVLQDETIDKIINYMQYQINVYRPRKLTVVYSGGEPLLNIKAVLSSSRRLNDSLSSKGVEFHFSIVTNGTVQIKPKELLELKRNGLNLIQISLDGPMHIHNSRRYASFDVYKRVINFIHNVVTESIPITIRVNIDRGNIDSLDQMYKELEINDKSNVSISYYLTEKPVCDRKKCETSNDFEYDESLLNLAIEMATKNGFRVWQNRNLKSCCMCNVPFNTVIDPNGNVYKCGGMIGVESEYLGNINNPETTDKQAHQYVMERLKSECYTCKLLPMCMGGCNYQRYGEENCSESYKEYVLRKIENRLIKILKDRGSLTANS